MDTSLSPEQLHERLGGFPPPLLIDGRRVAAYEASEKAIAGTIRRDPDQVQEWAGDLEIGRPVIVHCVHGLEVGPAVAAALRERGFDARYLAGGIEGWAERGLPIIPKPTVPPSLWVTRERPKIDRIACPWLIRRFVDPDARFLYVPAGEVLTRARETGATPYDIPGVEFSHDGDLCSFDAFIRRFDLKDPALGQVALIVRGADTSRLDLTPASTGLFGISLGLSALFPDDHRMLRHGLIVYDALYLWCRSLKDETHNWPPQMPATGGKA